MTPPLRVAACALIGLLISPAPANPRARMVKDINREPGGASRSIQWLAPSKRGVLLNSYSIKNGDELWLANDRGTRLLKDIRPGTMGSTPIVPNTHDGIVYFRADDGAHGAELWRSDGTAKGTKMVIDFTSGPESSPLIPLFATNEVIFFYPFSTQNGEDQPLCCVKVSGGAAVELNPLVEDPGQPLQRSFSTFSLVEWGGVPHFISRSTELWKTDGSAAGTLLVENLPLPEGSIVASMTPAGDALLLVVMNFSKNSQEFWIHRPSQGTTEKLADLGSPNFIGSGTVQRSGDRFFCFAGGNDHTLKLWVTDGTAQGTRMLKEAPGGEIGLLPGMATWKGEVYFSLIGPTGKGSQIWRSNGTVEGTSMVKEVRGETEEPILGYCIAADRHVYFQESGWSPDTPKLWRTDGTAAGTLEIPRDADQIPYLSPVPFRDAIYMAVETDRQSQLWKSLGTPRSTRPVLRSERSTRSACGLVNFGVDNGIVSAGGQLLLAVTPGGNDFDIWRSDGTADGTRAAWSVSGSPETDEAGIEAVATLGSRGLFDVRDLPEAGDRRLMISDGTGNGTTLLKDFSEEPPHTYPVNFFTIGDQCFFITGGPADSTRLWKTDGTAEGTVEVTTAAGASIEAYPYLTEMDDILYFFAWSSPGGDALWRSDGTAEGTFRVKSIHSVWDFNESHLMRVGDRLSFFSGFSDKYLWTSDGTSEGTKVIAEIEGTPVYPRDSGGKLLFAMVDGDGGLQPTWYTSDGSTATPYLTMPAGTMIFPYQHPLNRRYATVAGGQLFFSSSLESEDPADSIQQVWRTDGTAQGTILLLQLTPSFAQDWRDIEFQAVGNEVYFGANDGIHGFELWRSDGSVEGTRMAADIEPGPVGSYPGCIVPLGSKLFFHADRRRFGRELHVLQLPNPQSR